MLVCGGGDGEPLLPRRRLLWGHVPGATGGCLQGNCWPALRCLTALRVLELMSLWAAAGRGGRGGDEVPAGLDPKVIAVYKGVGEILRRYTTGRVPKAFKVPLFLLAARYSKFFTAHCPEFSGSGNGWREVGPWTLAAQSGSCLLLVFQQDVSHHRLLFPSAQKTACPMHTALKFRRILLQNVHI